MKHILRFALLFVLVASASSFGAIAPSVFAQGGEQARVTQVDASNFPKVTVYISVTGPNGEPIGVDPARITLYEDGQAIKPDSIRASGKQTGQVEPVTTLLVMDVSGSMNEGGKLEGAKNAARAYVEQMRPGDQAGLVAFNDKVQNVQPITPDRNKLKVAIDRLTAENNTAMYDALVEGSKILAPVQGRKAIIALSDGMDNRSANNADKVISEIGPAGLTISIIGLGDPALGTSQFGGIDEPRLRSLTDRAGGLYAFANDSASLRKIYEQYARVLQNEYAITFTSFTHLRDGVNRSLNVSLAAPGGAPINAAGKYNPGGVVPEVAQASSPVPIFPVALAVLFALLLLPGIVTRAGEAIGLDKRGGRVRLGTSNTAFSKSKAPGRLRRASAAVIMFLGRIGKKKKPRVRIYDASQSRLRTR